MTHNPRLSVFFCGRAEAEDTTPQPDVAVISISDPTSVLPDIQAGWAGLLHVRFHDIDLTKHKNPFLRAEILQSYTTFSELKAAAIVQFVDQYAEEGVRGFLVHCEAGISRSAAVAMWIAHRFDLPLVQNVSRMNRYVYELLEEMGG